VGGYGDKNLDDTIGLFLTSEEPYLLLRVFDWITGTWLSFLISAWTGRELVAFHMSFM
jgi:hypothetical protein